MDRRSCQELWWIWDLTYLQVNKSPCHRVTKFLISKTRDRRFLDQKRRTVYYSQQQQHPDGRHFYSGPPGFIFHMKMLRESNQSQTESQTGTPIYPVGCNAEQEPGPFAQLSLNISEDWFPDTLQVPKSADAWDPSHLPFHICRYRGVAVLGEQACLLIALEGDIISVFKDSWPDNHPWKDSLEHLQAVQKHARSRNMQNLSKDFSRQEY